MERGQAVPGGVDEDWGGGDDAGWGSVSDPDPLNMHSLFIKTQR